VDFPVAAENTERLGQVLLRQSISAVPASLHAKGPSCIVLQNVRFQPSDFGSQCLGTLGKRA
jgi:hypothetical protein